MSKYQNLLHVPAVTVSQTQVLAQLRLWYERARAKLPDTFRVVVLDCLKWETHSYVNGEAMLSAPPCTEQFTGTVCGRKINGKFQAWVALNEDGEVEGDTLQLSRQRLQQMGFTPLTVNTLSASDLQTIWQQIMACEADALVLPADAKMVNRMVDHRVVPGLRLQVSRKGTVEEIREVEKALLPVAVLTGELRHPVASYISDLAVLGFQVRSVVDTDGPLPDDVSLVVYPSRGKKTPWAEAAIRTGKLAYTATDLAERVRAARLRKGG